MGVLVGVWVQTPFHLWLKCCALISCQPRHGPTGPQAHIFCGLIEDWVALMQRGHAGKLGFPLPHSPSHIKGAPAVGQGAPPPSPGQLQALPLQLEAPEPRVQGRALSNRSASYLLLGWPCLFPPSPNRPRLALLHRPAPGLAAPWIASALSLICQVFRCAVSAYDLCAVPSPIPTLASHTPVATVTPVTFSEGFQ